MEKDILYTMIVNQDCLAWMATQPNHSIDMVLTSPPYDDIRDYHGYNFNAESVLRELYRIVVPGGVVVWNVADATVKGSETGTSMRQALAAIDIGWLLHDTQIYLKRNPMPTNVKTRRYHQAWEYLFVFSKGRPRAWNPIMVPARYAGSMARMKYRGQDGEIQYRSTPRNAETKVRNVFEYTIGGGHSSPDLSAHAHPAVMPIDLARDQIQTWSNPGDIIYDPFAGAGTTLLAAQLLGRRSIGTEISAAYCQIAQNRLI